MSAIGAETFKWEDQDKRLNIMFRMNRNIKYGDNVVVREDEIAAFYRDGKVLTYMDRPDRYALTDLNAPIVGKLVKALSGAQQQAEIIYLQKRAFDGKFGSKQPFQFRDKEFGMVNLRVFGEFRYKVSNPENFVNQFVGTLNFASSAEVEERIKEQVVLLVYSAIGDMKNQGMGVADLASNLPNIEQVVLSKSNDQFALYGVGIDKISGLYVSMPDEVQKAVDTRASMQITGTNYVQYQSGQAMREAATNPSGGAAGVGVGLGAGMGMGYTMMDSMRSGGQQPAPGATPPQPQQIVLCPKCGATNAVGAKFCQSCGAKLVVETIPCPKCGAQVNAEVKFCPECGNPMKATKKCPKCGTDSPAGAKFCPECGTTF